MKPRIHIEALSRQSVWQITWAGVMIALEVRRTDGALAPNCRRVAAARNGGEGGCGELIPSQFMNDVKE